MHCKTKHNKIFLAPTYKPRNLETMSTAANAPGIGADSTGAEGKLPRYPRNNRGKSIILPRYYFAPVL